MRRTPRRRSPGGSSAARCGSARSPPRPATAAGAGRRRRHRSRAGRCAARASPRCRRRGARRRRTARRRAPRHPSSGRSGVTVTSTRVRPEARSCTDSQATSRPAGSCTSTCRRVHEPVPTSWPSTASGSTPADPFAARWWAASSAATSGASAGAREPGGQARRGARRSSRRRRSRGPLSHPPRP